MNFSVDEELNAIVMSVDNIVANYKSDDFYYYRNFVVKAKEQVEIEMNEVKIEVVIKLTT